MTLPILNPQTPDQAFPPLDTALTDPDGLLAIGGCLSPQRLINAYQHGIFPWYSPDEPILWWSPDPRLVLFPERLYLSRRLKKTIRQDKFTITFDQQFPQVMQACAAPRTQQSGTWITESIYLGYVELHRQGIAHSVEVWLDQQLVGGLYGVAIGQVFFGESMFYRQTDASKVAFYYLTQYLIDWGYQLIDCQVHSHHLVSLGAEEIKRKIFVRLLTDYCALPVSDLAWKILP